METNKIITDVDDRKRAIDLNILNLSLIRLNYPNNLEYVDTVGTPNSGPQCSGFTYLGYYVEQFDTYEVNFS